MYNNSMNILDLPITPLTDEEMIYITTHYIQDFNKMDIDAALTLLKLLLSTSKEYLDSELSLLVIRRLYMIIEWDKYPERLI